MDLRSEALRADTAALPLPRSQRRRAAVAIIFAASLPAADATIANVILSPIERDLGGGLVLGAWIVTSYLCANAVVAPLTGWLRRRFGARALFSGAVGLFIAASLLCSLSQGPAAIIVGRLLQGAGGGLIHPLAQAILLDLYPREQHGRMLAIWGATIMVGPVVAPALGGIIADLGSWRWVFAINVPLGAAIIWCVRRLLPKAEIDGGDGPVDLLGVALLAVAVGALQLSLERGVGQSWLDSPELLIETAIAAGGFAVIAVRARRVGFGVFRPDSSRTSISRPRSSIILPLAPRSLSRSCSSRRSSRGRFTGVPRWPVRRWCRAGLQ
jgi:DHA2 family multidrug resistance protein